MLLIAEKGIRGGICQVIPRYAKANNRYMKNYDKNTTSSYLMYLDANNLHGCAMSQKLPVNGFEWVKKLPKFDDRFIKIYDENIRDAIKTASKEQFKKQQKQLAILSIPKLLIKLTSVSRSCTQ